MEPLTNDFWLNEAALLYTIVFDIVDEAASVAAVNAAMGVIQQLLYVATPEIDYTAINAAAHTYARQHSFNLVSQVTQTSKRALQGALSDWIYSGKPLRELVETLTPLFGPVRAEMIAVTEITRVYAESNKIGWREYGVEQQRWNTAVDDIVCPICAPKHRKLYGLDDAEGTPPAHVNCRCWNQAYIDPWRTGVTE